MRLQLVEDERAAADHTLGGVAVGFALVRHDPENRRADRGLERDGHVLEANTTVFDPGRSLGDLVKVDFCGEPS